MAANTADLQYAIVHIVTITAPTAMNMMSNHIFSLSGRSKVLPNCFLSICLFQYGDYAHL